jgi:hypothetical protein
MGGYNNGCSLYPEFPYINCQRLRLACGSRPVVGSSRKINFRLVYQGGGNAETLFLTTA